MEINADPWTRQTSPKKSLPCVAGVAGGGGREGSRTLCMPPVWRGGAEKALRQTHHSKGTMARRALVDMEGNTDANRGKSHAKNLPRAIGKTGG